MTPDGALTTLISLTLSNSPADLLLGQDGNLYGIDYNGSGTFPGTIFVLTSGGISNLVTLAGSIGNPAADIVQGADGNFYGTGASSIGTIFKAAPAGSLSTLFTFNGTTGSLPTAPLTQAADGNFYGSTLNGGANGYGVVYRISPSGTFSNLFSFGYTNGAFTDAEFAQTADGSLYGTTSTAGSEGGGNIFKLYQVINAAPIIFSANQNANALTFMWSAMVGRNYQVQYSTDLSQRIWSNLGGQISATNAIMSASDTTSSDSQRFYRIQLQ